MGFAPLRDHRSDPALPEQATALVVAAVGQQGMDLVEQWQQLGDVVAVAAGQRHRERDALPVDDEVVLVARPCAVDRAGTAFGPLRAARTCEESITALDQSSWFFDRSFSSSTTCNWSQIPAPFQAARRRQQVIPEPKPSSWGRYSHWIPVCRTKRIPHKACRSGTRGLPSTSFGACSGSNGSMSDQSSSDTIQGRRGGRFRTTRPTSRRANSQHDQQLLLEPLRTRPRHLSRPTSTPVFKNPSCGPNRIRVW